MSPITNGIFNIPPSQNFVGYNFVTEASRVGYDITASIGTNIQDGLPPSDCRYVNLLPTEVTALTHVSY